MNAWNSYLSLKETEKWIFDIFSSSDQHVKGLLEDKQTL